jgi:pectate lyase
MTTWHGYLIVERGDIGAGNWANLRAMFAALGPATASQPAYLNHWREVDADTTIYEARFDASEVTQAAFKQMLADEFSVPVENIHVDTHATSHGGAFSRVWSYRYPGPAGAVRFTVHRCAGGGSWQESGHEARAYLGAQAGHRTAITGGAGGARIEVATTAALVAALETSGAREVVITAPGYYEPDKQVVINSGDLTLTTAPGVMACIRHGNLMVSADNVIIRNLRIRPAVLSTGTDAVSVFNGSNVLIQFCSLSWTDDELCSITNSHNVTLEWCLLYEGMAGHNLGSLVKYSVQDVDIHHCLYAHVNGRQPQMYGDAGATDARFGWWNNVVYNQGQWAGEIKGSSRLDAIGNMYRRGVDSQNTRPFEVFDVSGMSLYLAGNVDSRYGDVQANLVYNRSTAYTWRTTPHVFRYIPHTAAEAWAAVLAGAGAWPRDSADTRVLADATNGTGAIVYDPRTHGWPLLA